MTYKIKSFIYLCSFLISIFIYSAFELEEANINPIVAEVDINDTAPIEELQAQQFPENRE